ncbi:MAG: phytanoyl-CoA dioxygenase family protein [Geodermatophilaceae bacterium]|jgi:ectoine hydroxylase-related dioxygenase (phytanoyl-CoA dioxygenase family)
MRTGFTQQEIAEYRTHGFLSVPDFLSREELARWREVVDSAVAANHRELTGRNSEKAFTQRMHLRRTDPALAGLVDDPRIGNLVADLEGVAAVRLYLDQALVKEPYGSPTQYHLDIPWWAFSSEHACTVWVALDDATLENGCLYFVPGSQKLRLNALGDLGPDLGALFKAHPEAATAATPSPLPAGGCSFHNGHTIHGAGANMTPGRRRAMTIAFMPAGVAYNGRRDAGVLGEEYLDSLLEGDPLDNDELNPLVFARS